MANYDISKIAYGSNEYTLKDKDLNAVRLKPTGDNTDRSSEILSILTNYGVCRLEPGEYYVSGFEMPEDTKLYGCGRNTVLKLLSSVTNGYCVRIHKHNTVSGIFFSGGDSAPTNIYTEDAPIGTRHGIYLAANADGSGAAKPDSKTNIVTECFFENFSGGGFTTENTGQGLINGVLMSNCWFMHCMVGINIPYNAEYSRYDNCLIFRCNIACLNNGGNNMFSNCSFHGVKGMVIDNSSGTHTNSSHGSCVCCTFNHIDNMNKSSTLGGGKAIYVNGANHGFVFSGCQIWYASIDIVNTQGIVFSDCVIAGNVSNSCTITVSGNYGAYFHGCIFGSTHADITVNQYTQFYNCFDKSTSKNVNPDWVTSNLVNENGKNRMLKVTRVGRSNNDATATYTYYGVTYTVNSDGTITVTRTSANSNESVVWLYSPDTTKAILCNDFNDGTYVLASGRDESQGSVSMRIKSGSGSTDYISLMEYATIPTVTGVDMNISIRVLSTFTGTITIRPMICKKAYYLLDKTYVEHAPTNAELYQMISAMQA